MDDINFKSTSKRFKNMRAKSRSLEEIMIETQRTYDEDPRGWGISLGMGKDGYGNIFISGPKGLWQIKVDSIYKPKPIGVGARVGAVDEFKKLISTKIPSYGFRPINEDQMSRLREGMSRHRPLDEIVGEILSAKPSPLGKLRGPGIVQGPIIHSNFHGYMSSKQKELDSKLKRNLDKLLFREGIGGMHY